MDYFDTLLRRNGEFVSLGFNPNLRMMPSSKTLIIGLRRSNEHFQAGTG